MLINTEYINLLRQKGRSLESINPGSDEFALKVNDAFEAIDLLQKNNIAILGGDIMSLKSGELVYAYHYWGEAYHSLNWYTDKMEGENDIIFVKRSAERAREAIEIANRTANDLGKECYITLVI